MVSPVFVTKTFVATNAAENFAGNDTIEKLVFIDDLLVEVIDAATGIDLAGGPVFDGFGNRIAGTAFLFDVFDNITVDYSGSPLPVRIDLAAGTGQGGFAQGDSLLNVFSIFGSDFNDVIRGSNVLTEFEVGPFNDPGENSLFGGKGDDILEGRTGPDLINGGPGSDTASYESSAAAVVVTVNDPTTSAFTATGGDAQGDHLFSIENVVGSRFDDRLTGASNNNLFAPGLGFDIVDGKVGTDTVDYSSDRFFDDTPGSRETPDHVVVNLDTGRTTKFIGSTSTTDRLTSIENVIGSRGDDIMTGNDVANTLEGRNGADTLDGGFGNDVLIGGGGIDTASFASHNSDLALVGGRPDVIELGVVNGFGVETADGSYTRVTSFIDIGGRPIPITETDVLRTIENITGSNRAEVITGNDLANTIDGRAGDDTIDGGLGNDVLIGGNPIVAVGGGLITSIDTVSYASHDSITIALGADVISLGLNGADGSYVRTGFVGGFVLPVETDVLRGFENVTGSNRAETITGNEQANVLDGRGGNDTLKGGAGNDTLKGGDGDDTYDFRGTANFGTGDTIFDSSGFDTVLINSLDDVRSSTFVGDDIVSVLVTGTYRIIDARNHPIERALTSDGQTFVMATGSTGGNGSGILSGTDGDDTLDGRGGDDWLFGNRGNDTLLGGTGNDHLLGGIGNDDLHGQEGDDILNGGPGHDRLFGEAGNDVFVVAPTSPGKLDLADLLGLLTNHTTIEDFVSGQDRIDLTAFHTSFNALTGHGHSQNDHGHDDGLGPLLVTAGHDSLLIFEGGLVRVEGVTHLHASDFLF